MGLCTRDAQGARASSRARLCVNIVYVCVRGRGCSANIHACVLFTYTLFVYRYLVVIVFSPHARFAALEELCDDTVRPALPGLEVLEINSKPANQNKAETVYARCA